MHTGVQSTGVIIISTARLRQGTSVIFPPSSPSSLPLLPPPPPSLFVTTSCVHFHSTLLVKAKIAHEFKYLIHLRIVSKQSSQVQNSVQASLFKSACSWKNRSLDCGGAGNTTPTPRQRCLAWVRPWDRTPAKEKSKKEKREREREGARKREEERGKLRLYHN